MKVVLFKNFARATLVFEQYPVLTKVIIMLLLSKVSLSQNTRSTIQQPQIFLIFKENKAESSTIHKTHLNITKLVYFSLDLLVQMLLDSIDLVSVAKWSECSFTILECRFEIHNGSLGSTLLCIDYYNSTSDMRSSSPACQKTYLTHLWICIRSSPSKVGIFIYFS